MTKTTRSLIALLILGVGFLAFYLAANGGFWIASPTVFGIIGFLCFATAAGMTGMEYRIRK